MRLAYTLIALAALAPSVASAQELTGTYIGYAAMAPNGTLVNTSTGHSMQYRESTTSLFSCDVFYPGSPVEEFSIEGTSTVAFVATNPAGSGGDFVTLSGPTVVGREIRWTGRYTSGSTILDVDQVLTYGSLDRHAVLTVTITNAGAASIRDLYYLRDGDPDHGQCNIGTDYTTVNDVIRQPPAMTSALVVAGTYGASPTVYFGMGANDSRARVSSSGSLSGLDPSDSWLAPTDPGGAAADQAIGIVFRETSLGIGASTTFRIYYVWGPDSTTVATRFDAAAGGIMPGCGAEGAACTLAGAAGRCRSGSCCTGCWDGFACQTGTTTSACGGAGSTCTSCDDFNTCTTDSCGATRTCSNAPSIGTRCGEPFCEAGVMHAASMCDALGSCRAGTTTACTSGSCSTPTTCAEGCASDAACGLGFYCEASRCLPGGGIGASCTRDAMCSEGSCVDNVCCFPGTEGCGGGTDAGPIPGEDAGGVPGEDAGVEPGTDAGVAPGVDAGRPGGGVGGRHSSRGGCSVGATGESPDALAWLLALGLATLLARRRR